MTEEFLHHLWKYKLFDVLNLQTTEGERIEIIRSGDHNSDAGPDFFNAKIKIGETLWAGNVEVHTQTSDWKRHKHGSDAAYDNIILHVVHTADEQLKRKNGEVVPTLELKDLFAPKLYQNYLSLRSSKNWIACEHQIISVPPVILNATLDKLLIERLERKSFAILESLKHNKNNWEESFYHALARNFGFNTNATPFELLARSIPLTVLAKHKNSLLQIEALFFGQAGFLNEHLTDKYLQALQNEYVLLKHKFKLQPIDKHLWKFLRLYPANFPTVRIAQFADLVHRSSHLFSKILETGDLNTIKKLLNARVSEYWETHYSFEKTTKRKAKILGEQSVDVIIINTIVPFLFVYGKQYKNETYYERALRFLELLKGESNHITKKWKSLKMPVNTPYSTQALLQLKNEYCEQKKCLHCSIGNYLLKN